MAGETRRFFLLFLLFVCFLFSLFSLSSSNSEIAELSSQQKCSSNSPSKKKKRKKNRNTLAVCCLKESKLSWDVGVGLRRWSSERKYDAFLGVCDITQCSKNMTVVCTALLLENAIRQKCRISGVRESFMKEVILVRLIQNAEKHKSKRRIFSPLLVPWNMAPAATRCPSEDCGSFASTMPPYWQQAEESERRRKPW